MPFYDSHTHTRLCGHAVDEPVDYAKFGAKTGLAGMIVTDHNPFQNGWESQYRMAWRKFPKYLKMVEKAREKFDGIFDVRLGIECDYVDGMISEIEKVCSLADFDFVLGSLHLNMGSNFNRFFNGDVLEFTKIYFEQLGDAAETGFFDAISHPDIPKFMFPEHWDFELVREDVCVFLDRLQKTGLAIELNTSGVLKRYPEMNPGREMLELINDREIPVILGSDAHNPARVGDGFVTALNQLKSIGFETVSYFINRKRHDESIDAVLRELDL